MRLPLFTNRRITMSNEVLEANMGQIGDLANVLGSLYSLFEKTVGSLTKEEKELYGQRLGELDQLYKLAKTEYEQADTDVKKEHAYLQMQKCSDKATEITNQLSKIKEADKTRNTVIITSIIAAIGSIATALILKRH